MNHWAWFLPQGEKRKKKRGKKGGEGGSGRKKRGKKGEGEGGGGKGGERSLRRRGLFSEKRGKRKEDRTVFFLGGEGKEEGKKGGGSAWLDSMFLEGEEKEGKGTRPLILLPYT